MEKGNLNNKIKVVYKEVDKPAVVKEIDHDYREFQKIVGGLFDMTTLPNNEDIDIICNDEYLYNGSMANVMMPERENVLCGNLLFAGYNAEDGSAISLTDEQISAVMQYIEKNKVFNMNPEMAYYAMLDRIEFEKLIREDANKDMVAE